MGTPADETGRDGGAHYFDGVPEVDSSPRLVDVVLPDLTLRLASDRGVFSSDRLDAGTKLLLLESPPIEPHETTVLDLGCGWGVIACVAALRAPHAQVWAVDVNERAVALTIANAAGAGVTERVHVGGPDDLPGDVRFARILSNPPIRIGKPALHDLLGTWLDRLEPQGRAHFVVQRHLGSDSLARWLEQRGHRVERLKSRSGYRVLDVGPRKLT